MKLIIYINGGQLKHFPSLAGLEESRVKFEAVRLNRDVVRWKLIGDKDILKKYWEAAQRHGVAYGLS